MNKTETVEVENIVSPGSRRQVDATKYGAMRKAVIAVLPKVQPGMTVGELRDAVVATLPEALFPGGAKAGWWLKCVQLDLEAKGVVKRGPKAPVRLFLA